MDNMSGLESFRGIFDKVEEFFKKDKPYIIAIDGMSGSGKSYLSKLLAQKYEANVFHMDDFYLPLEMRTKERLNQPGGNVYYERFREEVLDPIIENKTVIYRPYLCGRWKYDKPRLVEYKRFNIIEGTYSMHPYLRDGYDLRIFLELETNVQRERILHREGKDKLQQFLSKWIPLENMYFKEFNIKEFCDITLDTTYI